MCAVISVGSASGALDRSKDLLSVQQQVAGIVPDSSVAVTLTSNRHLTINVASTSVREWSSDAKSQKSMQVAKAGYAAYPLRATLAGVDVNLSGRARVGLATAGKEIGEHDSFSYRSAQLVAGTRDVVRRMSAPAGVVLYLLPIGNLPQKYVDAVSARVRAQFSMPVTVLPPAAFEHGAEGSVGPRVVADDLIAFSRERYAATLRETGARLIAITPYDMYTPQIPRWDFTFALRDDQNRVAVVSYARMDPTIFDNEPDDELLESRLRKMIIKNVGILCYARSASTDSRSVLYGNIGGTDELDLMTEEFDP
jgi:hypothetical protein